MMRPCEVIGRVSSVARMREAGRCAVGQMPPGEPALRLAAHTAASPGAGPETPTETPTGDWDVGTVVEERPAAAKLKPPPMYKVVLLNDDYTRMEFVVHVLMRFFDMGAEKATQVMLAIHTNGRAVVGTYPRDVAETKSEQVNAYAQQNDFPLRSTVETAD